MQAHEIASRFARNSHRPDARPARLNDSEKQDRDQLSDLRGALYSKD